MAGIPAQLPIVCEACICVSGCQDIADTTAGKLAVGEHKQGQNEVAKGQN